MSAANGAEDFYSVEDHGARFEGMAIRVVEFPREGYNIRKVFGLKSTVVKLNYQKLMIGLMASCQKLRIILENKVKCFTS